MENHIEQWLADRNEQLIICPYQPGNLRISASSCAKRYDMAQRRLRPSRDQDADLALNANLERCRHCKIGEEQFARLQN